MAYILSATVIDYSYGDPLYNPVVDPNLLNNVFVLSFCVSSRFFLICADFPLSKLYDDAAALSLEYNQVAKFIILLPPPRTPHSAAHFSKNFFIQMKNYQWYQKALWKWQEWCRGMRLIGQQPESENVTNLQGRNILLLGLEIT